MTPTAILLDRLARIDHLSEGAHESPNGDFAACAMEAARDEEREAA